MKRRIKRLIASVAIPTAATIVLHGCQDASEDSLLVDENEPRSTTSQEKPAGFSQDKEIGYSNFVSVRDTSISIDGGLPQSVPCSTERDTPLAFGYVVLDGRTKAQLTCADDYLGGIAISYLDANGESVSRDVATNGGDAGDQWDTRSWITTRRHDKQLTIETITLSSSIELMDGSLLGCSVARTIYRWDGKAKELVGAAETSDLDLASSPLRSVSRPHVSMRKGIGGRVDSQRSTTSLLMTPIHLHGWIGFESLDPVT